MASIDRAVRSTYVCVIRLVNLTSLASQAYTRVTHNESIKSESGHENGKHLVMINIHHQSSHLPMETMFSSVYILFGMVIQDVSCGVFATRVLHHR